MKRFALLCVLWMSAAFALANAIDVYEFDSPEQEARFRALTHELRCPKCQNNSIADSNAELAQDLRQKVHQMLQQGRSDEEILSFMVAIHLDLMVGTRTGIGVGYRCGDCAQPSP